MLLLILVFMPFLAGILLFITGRRNERARDILAVVVCGLALLAAVAAPQVPDPFWCTCIDFGDPDRSDQLYA